MFFLFNAFSFDNDADLAAKVAQAADDEKAFAELSKQFEKHNRFAASRATGRFISESDDEWSVVLIAFYEAVRKYSPDKGSFIAFSDMVIKRRLIDHMRSQSRKAGEFSADLSGDMSTSDENDRCDPAARRMSEEAGEVMELEKEAGDIRSEIEALDRTLADYGIKFADLPGASPKSEKTRNSCARAVMQIVNDPGLLEAMKSKARLPAKELSKRCGLPLKLLDNHRKYIIAVVEIMTGGYTSLQQYTAGISKRAGS